MFLKLVLSIAALLALLALFVMVAVRALRRFVPLVLATLLRRDRPNLASPMRKELIGPFGIARVLNVELQ